MVRNRSRIGHIDGVTPEDAGDLTGHGLLFRLEAQPIELRGKPTDAAASTLFRLATVRRYPDP